MHTLARGQRCRLAEFGLDKQPFTLDLAIAAGGLAIDVACFGLDGRRKLSDERYMTFFNQPESPCGGVRLAGPTSFRFDFARLPAAIDALVVTLAIDGVGVMSALGASQASLSAPGAMVAFPFQGAFFAAERAVMLLEFYRKDGQWRINAVAQGFNGGLDALVQHFGGTVEQAAPPAAAPPPAPKVSLSKITLTKPQQTHRISLEKSAGAPRKIVVKATWTDNGDASGDNDDLDLRVGLLLPNGKMIFIQAPDRSGAFDCAPFVRHLGDVTSASAAAPATETVEVNPRIGQLCGGAVALVFSVYSAVANGQVSVGALAPKMVMEYGDQIVECAFDFTNTPQARLANVYTYVIGLVEIDGDSIRLSPSGQTSEPDSEWTPWLTRKGDKISISMDGPAVFKGELAPRAAEVNRHNPHRYAN
ncbi:MAG: TerD family protein [Rhodocyclaceae bacterium]|nr:TerD family protein [Rhodocyclaceae bacterium]